MPQGIKGYKWSRLENIFLFGTMAFALGVMWFASNFLYSLFWAWLDQWHFKEADVIAYTLAHLVPFIFTICVGIGLYFLVRREIARQIWVRAEAHPGQAHEAATVSGAAAVAPVMVTIVGDTANTQGLVGAEKLFRINQNRSEVSLRFFPKTGPKKRDDALLLIIYGYKTLLGIESVKKSVATFAVNEALATAPNSPVPHFIAQLQSVMFYEQDYGIEYEKCGLLEVTGLSKGEFYRLTPDGEARAEQLAKDSISRA